MDHYAHYERQHGETRPAAPAWMSEGFDGTGRGLGLYREHPLSQLKGNTERTPENTPKMLRAMITGIYHKSGVVMYFRGGKVPNPMKHPYLTGEPCPVYGWRVLDGDVIRKFEAPTVEKEKQRYKPYVAVQERELMKADNDLPAVPQKAASGKDDGKPLLKRLFFWK